MTTDRIPTRIVLTVAALVPESGGPSRTIPALADALAGQGREVSLVALDFQRFFSPPLLPKHPAVRTTLVPCATALCRATRHTRAFARTLRGLLTVTGRCVLHDNGVWLGTNHLAARTAADTRTPLVISPRGMLTDWAMRHHGLAKRMAWRLYQRRALARAGLLHATAREEADSLRRLGCRQPIAVIPNGVAVPEQERPATDAPLRRALFLSRVHPIKGVLDLVAAWAELRPTGWELVIGGDDEGGHSGEVEAAIRAAGLSGECRVIGTVRDADKWEQYAAADLLVLPSYSESFGMVVAEALGCGRPVITTTATPWSGVASRRCGWCVPPGREPVRTALAAALALPRAALREMGDRGRVWIRAEFSWAEVARKLGEAYDFLLGNTGRPATIQ